MAAPTSTALSHTPPAATLELLVRRLELASLQESIGAREAALAQLRRQLHSFEARYIRQVGVLYVQLDEWQDRLEELLQSRLPAAAGDTPQPEGYWSAERLAVGVPETEASPTTALRAIFRQVVKHIHPDRASDDNDAVRRTALMAQANDALERGDTALLQRMLHGHEATGHAREDPAAALARVAASIAQAEADLLSLAAEHEAMAASEMARLRDATAAAALEGRDHLAEMAARVRGMIGGAMGRYEREASPHRRPAPIDAESLLSAEQTPVRSVATRAD